MTLRSIVKGITTVCVRRSYSNVRVRFAPSPTGNIHLGGLRTALLNYLFAKKHDGTFILRLEDTDQSRLVKGSAEKLERILNLSGIIPDEGPSQGGPNGPYVQSQRLDMYQNMIKDLLNTGSAYKCYCTEARLDILRKEALKRQETPRYDNKCRFLSENEKRKLSEEHRPYCIRFKLESGPWTFTDLVYGELTLTLSEGDPVILKADGFPTYHFACVVDDHLMEVTHVLRGVEWQVSTTKHLMLYKAFGWEPPNFSHLPLLLNKDGTKLSKRHGDIDIETLLNRGFYPEAILNLLASTGGGFGTIYEDMPALDLQEMIQQFDFGNVNVSSSKIDLDKLPYFNQNSLIKKIQNCKEKKSLVDSLEALLRHLGSQQVDIERGELERILEWSVSTKRISTLNDLLNPLHSFLWKKPELLPESFQQQDDGKLRAVVERLEFLPEESFVINSLTGLLREVTSQKNYNFTAFMGLMRRVLSDQKVGPSVAEMLEMLGKSESLRRLRQGATLANKRL